MNTLVRYHPRALDVFGNFDRLLDFGRTSSPRVDIREDEDKYLLEAELPGATEKDIEVKVEDNLLTIGSKHDDSKKEEKNGYIVRERKYQAFSRSFVLPKDVNREKIDAKFKNGLLTLTLTKAPEAKPKRIEIKAT